MRVLAGVLSLLLVGCASPAETRRQKIATIHAANPEAFATYERLMTANDFEGAASALAPVADQLRREGDDTEPLRPLLKWALVGTLLSGSTADVEAALVLLNEHEEDQADEPVPQPRHLRLYPGAATHIHGQPVYPASDCIGAVVNGVCHGSILPRQAVPVRCFGTMLNGKCTGPMF